MRLIDADVLIEDLRELLYTDENPSEQLTDAGQAIHNAAIALAASEVEDAPTIDAAPVVHARWASILIPRRYGGCVIECSKCYNRGSRNFSFCPNCGAKMDEKEVGAR